MKYMPNFSLSLLHVLIYELSIGKWKDRLFSARGRHMRMLQGFKPILSEQVIRVFFIRMSSWAILNQNFVTMFLSSFIINLSKNFFVDF